MANPNGAPIKYEEDFARQVRMLCADGCFTDAKIAEFLKIHRSTIYEWKKTYQEFAQAIKEGKEEALVDEVERSMYKRAIGYKYTETTRELKPVIVVGPDGKQTEVYDITQKLIVTKKVRKEYPPETGAGCFVLKNRRPERWKDTKNLEHSGGVTITHEDRVAAVQKMLQEETAAEAADYDE